MCKTKKPLFCGPKLKKVQVEEPALKKGKGTTNPELDDGETKETIAEHINQIKKEMPKGSRNFTLIKESMGQTYKH